MKKFGFDSALDALKGLAPQDQERLFEQMEKLDPEKAKELKEAMFTFEDLGQINPKGIEVLFSEIPQEKWALAFRKASKKLMDDLFQNISRRKAEQIDEAIESLGPQPLSKVEEAQSEIIEIVRRLEGEGKLIIESDNSDPLV